MMNFKDWEKIEDNGKTVTMAHPKGHKMTIAVKALPKIQQEQIKRLKLAEGGKIETSEQGKDVRHAKKLKERGEEKDASIHMELAKEEAKGRADFERRAVKPNLKGLAHGGGVQYYDDGTPDAPVQAQTAITPLPPPPSIGAQYAAQPIPVDNVAIPQGRNNLNPNGTMNPSAVSENSQTAIGSQGDIEAAAAKANAAREQGYLSGTQSNEQRLQDNLNDVSKRVDDFAGYAATKPINIKHYGQTMDTSTKIATAFGLAFGGFGVPFGGHNYAMDFLNKQIDRDIDAQKTNLDTQKSVLGAYQQLYGERRAAYDATKASMIDAYTHQGLQIAAKLGTPQAIQRAMQFKANAAIEKSKLLQDAAVDLSDLPGTRPGITAPARQQSQPQQQGSGVIQSQPGAPGASNQDQSQGIMGNIMSGILPQAQAEELPKNKQSLDNYYEDHVLAPGANLKSLMYKPKARDQFKDIDDQYKKAQATEALLQSVNSRFKDIKDERNLPGAIASEINPNALGATLAPIGGALAGAAAAGALGTNPITVPLAGAGVPAAAGIGAGAGAALGEGIGYGGRWLLGKLGGQSERQYQSDRASLEKDLFAALKNTNASNDTIKDILDKNVPDYGDDEETMTKKLKNIKDFIKLATAGDRSLLQTWGLSPRH